MPYPMAYCSITTDRTQLVLKMEIPPALVHSMLLQNKLTSFTPWVNLSLLCLRCFEIYCQHFSQFQTETKMLFENAHELPMLASLRHLAMDARVFLSFLSVTLILALIVDYVRMLRLRSRMVSFMASLSSPIYC